MEANDPMNRDQLPPLTEIRVTSNSDCDACETTERWIWAHRGQSVELPAEVAAHVEACEACRAEQSEHLQLRLEAVPSPSDALFVRSVMARVRNEEAPVKRQRRSTIRVRAAAALALLLLPLTVLVLSAVDADKSETNTAKVISAPENAESSDDGSIIAAGPSVELDDWQSSYDRWDIDAESNSGWLPAFRGNDGAKEVVSF